MAKAKAKKGKSKKVRAARKPTELNAANVAKVKSAMTAEMKKVKAKDISKCEAIRNVAKRLGSVRRIEVEAALVKGFGLNLGTVRTQIQAARA